jgi:hypothetical protein
MRRLRRTVALVAGGLAVALLITAVVSDLRVRSALRQDQSTLATTRSRLSATLKKISSVERESRTLRSALGTTVKELSVAQTMLSSTRSNLSTANNGLVNQEAVNATLNKCLAGVEQALNQISVGLQSAALASLKSVAGSCQSLQGQGTGGAVFPFDFPDPDVIRVGSDYYAYATNSAAGSTGRCSATRCPTWQRGPFPITPGRRG